MKGAIVTNGYSTLAAAKFQANRLKEEFDKIGVKCGIFPNEFFGAHICGGEISDEFPRCDFCVYLDKDKYLSAVLEKSGMRLFNRHAAIRVCDDKMSTHIALAGEGINMPETFAGLLCYDGGAPLKNLDKIERALGYPLIIKECYGSLGKGVYKADNRAELRKTAEKLKLTPHLFQKFISESAGRDIRAIVIGGEIKAAMLRVSDGDFRSNIALGGTATAIEPDEDMRALCRKTSEILNLDYCGIDLLLGREGYLICEVNSNAFFGGIEAATGVNIARLYAGYIFEKMR